MSNDHVGQQLRNAFAAFGYYQDNERVEPIGPWARVALCIIPKKTISGKWVWLTVYYRRQYWVYREQTAKLVKKYYYASIIDILLDTNK